MFSFQIRERTDIISGEWDSSFGILIQLFNSLVFFLGTYPAPQTPHSAGASAWLLVGLGITPGHFFFLQDGQEYFRQKCLFWFGLFHEYMQGGRFLWFGVQFLTRPIRKRKWIWHWFCPGGGLAIAQQPEHSHVNGALHQAPIFCRWRRNWSLSSTSWESRKFCSFFFCLFVFLFN